MNDDECKMLESASNNMHILFMDLLKSCAEAREHGGFYLEHFDEAVTASMEALIKVKQAQSVCMRTEMGMGEQHDAN